jgi:predicted DNA-binding protein
MSTLAQLKAELAPQEDEAKRIREAFEALGIESQEDIDFANELLRDVKARWDHVEARRTAITKPLNEALVQANATFRPALTLFKQCETILKKKVADGIVHLRRVQTESLRLMAKQSAAGDMEAARATMLRMPDARLPERTSIREVWDFELVDFQQVPPDYLITVVDAEKVSRAVASGVRQIPGFRIYPRPSVTVRK